MDVEQTMEHQARGRGAGRGPSSAARGRAVAGACVDSDAVLGTLLATLRVQAGCALEDAAQASGVSARAIADAEAGDGRLPFTDARALARRYGYPFVAFAARYERALAAAERRARPRLLVVPAAEPREGAR